MVTTPEPDDLYAGYVLTEQGTYLVQVPTDNEWGFTLYSASGSWPGGFGVASSWKAVKESDVPKKIRDRLGWMLDEHRKA